MGNFLRKKQKPTLKYEKFFWQREFLVIGVDEVGKGAIAGPVTVCACVFPNDKQIFQKAKLAKIKINDSKKLTSSQREASAKWIKKQVIAWSIGNASASIVDKKGINFATIFAAKKAIKKILKKIKKKNFTQKIAVITDFIKIPDLEKLGIKFQKSLIKGDEKSFSVACASIVGKVFRDNFMKKLAKNFSFYWWQNNKGYGTISHLKAIAKWGISKHHRISFIKIDRILNKWKQLSS